jgi:organic hydroperoxide reductase OsmC/OhrA
MRTHHYGLTTRWTGNLGTGTSTYTAYSRNHELLGEGKGASIAGSSDPLFRGDRTRYNPEELLVGALSACHMLWVLHLSADAGIVITEYSDEAIGEMVEHEDGSGEFTRVVLRPRMSITDAGRTAEAIAIHHGAHQVCALARSMNLPVDCEPVVTETRA